MRFRTGDIIAIDTTEPCACGRSAMRFRVVGRSDDMVVIRGLNLFPTMVAGVLNGFAELSGDYRIVLDSKPPHDVLPLQVELAKEHDPADDLAARVAAKIKSSLGTTALVTIVAAGTFPVTAGKTARVLRTYQ